MTNLTVGLEHGGFSFLSSEPLLEGNSMGNLPENCKGYCKKNAAFHSIANAFPFLQKKSFTIPIDFLWGFVSKTQPSSPLFLIQVRMCLHNRGKPKV